MGTRSLTHVLDEDGDCLLTMYAQYDGYADGMGKDIFERFGNHKIINGFGSETIKDHANGMWCFAAQLVAHFKSEIGGYYLMKPDADSKEGYVYTLFLGSDEKLHMKLEYTYGNEILFDGLLADYGKWLALKSKQSQDEDEDDPDDKVVKVVNTKVDDWLVT